MYLRDCAQTDIFPLLFTPLQINQASHDVEHWFIGKLALLKAAGAATAAGAAAGDPATATAAQPSQRPHKQRRIVGGQPGGMDALLDQHGHDRDLDASHSQARHQPHRCATMQFGTPLPGSALKHGLSHGCQALHQPVPQQLPQEIAASPAIQPALSPPRQLSVTYPLPLACAQPGGFQQGSARADQQPQDLPITTPSMAALQPSIEVSFTGPGPASHADSLLARQSAFTHAATTGKPCAWQSSHRPAKLCGKPAGTSMRLLVDGSSQARRSAPEVASAATIATAAAATAAEVVLEDNVRASPVTLVKAFATTADVPSTATKHARGMFEIPLPAGRLKTGDIMGGSAAATTVASLTAAAAGQQAGAAQCTTDAAPGHDVVLGTSGIRSVSMGQGMGIGGADASGRTALSATYDSGMEMWQATNPGIAASLGPGEAAGQGADQKPGLGTADKELDVDDSEDLLSLRSPSPSPDGAEVGWDEMHKSSSDQLKSDLPDASCGSGGQGGATAPAPAPAQAPVPATTLAQAPAPAPAKAAMMVPPLAASLPAHSQSAGQGWHAGSECGGDFVAPHTCWRPASGIPPGQEKRRGRDPRLCSSVLVDSAAGRILTTPSAAADAHATVSLGAHGQRLPSGNPKHAVSNMAGTNPLPAKHTASPAPPVAAEAVSLSASLPLCTAAAVAAEAAAAAPAQPALSWRNTTAHQQDTEWVPHKTGQGAEEACTFAASSPAPGNCTAGSTQVHPSMGDPVAHLPPRTRVYKTSAKAVQLKPKEHLLPPEVAAVTTMPVQHVQNPYQELLEHVSCIWLGSNAD